MLKLEIGAKAMLTVNIDLHDRQFNGQTRSFGGIYWIF